MRNIAYPLRLSNGEPVEVEGADAVASAISLLTSQDNGERVYNDGNGLSIYPFVFENNDTLTRANIRRAYRLSVQRNEPRVDVLGVFVQTVAEAPNQGNIIETMLVWSYRGESFGFGRSFDFEGGGS